MQKRVFRLRSWGKTAVVGLLQQDQFALRTRHWKKGAICGTIDAFAFSNRGVGTLYVYFTNMSSVTQSLGRVDVQLRSSHHDQVA